MVYRMRWLPSTLCAAGALVAGAALAQPTGLLPPNTVLGNGDPTPSPAYPLVTTGTGPVVRSGSPLLTGTLTAGSGVFTSTATNAFTVGPQGIGNPGFNVDAAAPGAVTGIDVTMAPPGGGVSLSATSTQVNERLIINAKGAANIILHGVSSGFVGIGVAGPTAKLHVGGGTVRFDAYQAGCTAFDATGNVLSRQCIANWNSNGSITSITDSGAGVTLTAAQVIGKYIQRNGTPAGGFSDTMPGAAAIIDVIGGPGRTVTGISMELNYWNRTAQVATLVGAGGTTVTGTATVAANTLARFLLFSANNGLGTEAITLSRLTP
jgi:hypothetical protein